MTNPTPPPDRERLMHLLDRAERHVLTPTEAQLLRGAVTGLLELLEGPSGPPLAVACPVCSAPAGRRCVAVRGTVGPRVPHADRRRAAGAPR